VAPWLPVYWADSTIANIPELVCGDDSMTPETHETSIHFLSPEHDFLTPQADTHTHTYKL